MPVRADFVTIVFFVYEYESAGLGAVGQENELRVRKILTDGHETRPTVPISATVRDFYKST